jgi:hypothetical protein
MNAIVPPEQIELDPIRLDPRPCGLCGLTIDRHEQVDTPEGPEFLCIDFAPDEMTLDELERRAALRRQEDIAAILARMEAMDDRSKRVTAPLRADPAPYRPAQSTIDAFWFVVGLDDPGRLKAWFANHPRDVPALLKLLENKRC